MLNIEVNPNATYSVWQRSSFCSGNADCVIVASTMTISDSKLPDPGQAIITIESQIWNSLLDKLQESSTATIGKLTATQEQDGTAIITDGETTLEYTQSEWHSFLRGIEQKELYANESD